MDRMNANKQSAIELIKAVDNIDRCIDLAKGMAYALNTAIDVFPTPKDEEELDRLNTCQTSAMALLEVICKTLRDTSDSIIACARNSIKEAKHVH